MSRFIEPRGWSDMTDEKKASIVQNLAEVGLISVDLPEPSNALVERMGKNAQGSFDFFLVKHVIQTRGLPTVASGVESKQQADVLVKTFGDDVRPFIPAQVYARKVESDGLHF